MYTADNMKSDLIRNLKTEGTHDEIIAALYNTDFVFDNSHKFTYIEWNTYCRTLVLSVLSKDKYMIGQKKDFLLGVCKRIHGTKDNFLVMEVKIMLKTGDVEDTAAIDNNVTVDNIVSERKKTDEEQITGYFRSALAANRMKKIDFKNDQFWTLDISEVQRGMANSKVVDGVFAARDKDKSEKKGTGTDNVIIVLKTMKTYYEDTVKTDNNIEELMGVLFLPAILSKNGALQMHDVGNIPWIPREFLYPMVEPQLSLGSIANYDDYLEKTVDTRFQMKTWESYLEYAQNLFSAVYQRNKNISTDEENKIEFDEKFYLLRDNTVNASYHIMNLYNEMLKTPPASKLYQRFTRKEVEPSLELISNKDLNKMKEHCGQMGAQYPLSDSQREALNHFNAMNKGDILAINGPPGTGKTTLLQSIVADMYVKRALKQDRAPIIIASSTNNQAVTNIIDSFGKIDSVGIKYLEERWIKDVNNFAVYFPSGSKKAEAKKNGYQFTSVLGDDFCEIMDSADNIELSKKNILAMCEKYFEKSYSTLDQCRDILHQEMINIQKMINLIIDTFAEIKIIIGEDSLKDYLGDLIERINNLKQKSQEVNATIENGLAEIIHCRMRINEWESVYNHLPWYMRLFKIIPLFKRKINNHLNAFRSPEESVHISNKAQYEDIIEYYTNRIDLINRQIYQDKKELEILEADLIHLEKENTQIEHLKEKYCSYIYEMKSYRVDVTNKNPKNQCYLDNGDFGKINQLLDTSARYVQFWLAVHYFECRWAMKEDLINENQRGRNIDAVLDKLYHRLAMITPCMVTTFFMMPKQFLAFNNNEKKPYYLYDFVDLLIVDESGQVSPEIAAPSFSLAKRAVVVGDENQIPPVWGIDRALDIALAIQNNAIGTKAEYEKLLLTGLNCSESSVMKVASNSCKYEKYGKGLFLKEHRRCYNEIIEYCNQLVYGNHLQALRGYGSKDQTYPLSGLPHMGYLDLPIQKSKQQGCSRINKEEAKQIALWVNKNFKFITQSYKGQENVKEQEILGIITPFKAQVSIIRGCLNREAKEFADKISVGTVHTFQGAERKIIILSTVYGTEDGCFFIDRNKSLMNVAVSRAKDAFLVFGARNCLGSSTSSASGLLKKYVTISVDQTL